MKLLGSVKKAVDRLAGKKNMPGFGPGKTAGGVDSGRDAFVRLKDSEYEQTKSLLRKINLYRSQKKASKQVSFLEKRAGNRLRIVLLSLCLAAAFGLFMHMNGQTKVAELLKGIKYFHITAIEVTGCVNTPPENVKAGSKIVISSSLFSLDALGIEENIKEENHWVRKVRLIRNWPDKVVLDVEEYVPVALTVVGVGERAALCYMDADGEPFIETEAGMDLDYPIISGVEQTTGKERAVRLADAMSFLSLLQKNNPNLPSQSVSEINVDPDKGLVVHMVEYPFPIFFGIGDVKKKYYRLRKVLEKLYRYKPSKNSMGIADVKYIKMDYTSDKVLVGYSRNLNSG